MHKITVMTSAVMLVTSRKSMILRYEESPRHRCALCLEVAETFSLSSFNYHSTITPLELISSHFDTLGKQSAETLMIIQNAKGVLAPICLYLTGYAPVVPLLMHMPVGKDTALYRQAH